MRPHSKGLGPGPVSGIPPRIPSADPTKDRVVHKWHQTGRSEEDAARPRPIRVLLMEPSPEDAARVVEALRASGFDAYTEDRDSLDAPEGSLAGERDVLVT